MCTIKQLEQVLLFMLIFSFCLSSCGNNEDELVNKIEDSTVLNLDGKLVKSVGRYSFGYDTDGNLSSYNNYEVSINPFVLQRAYSDNREVISFFMNSQGFVSKINIVSTSQNKNNSTIEKNDYELTYNSFGQLTSMKVNSKYTDNNGEETFEETSTDNYMIKYHGNIINTIECKSVFYYEDQKEEEECLYRFLYETPYDNAFCQYTPEFAGTVFEDQTLRGLSYLGIFGKASTSLPSQMLFEYEGGHTEKHTCTYSFNPDGSLAQVGGTKYTYVSSTRTIAEDNEEVLTASERNGHKSHRHSLRIDTPQ